MDLPCDLTGFLDQFGDHRPSLHSFGFDDRPSKTGVHCLLQLRLFGSDFFLRAFDHRRTFPLLHILPTSELQPAIGSNGYMPDYHSEYREVSVAQVETIDFAI